MNKLITAILIFTGLLFSLDLIPGNIYTMNDAVKSRVNDKNAELILYNFEKVSGMNNDNIIVTHHRCDPDKFIGTYQHEEICFYSITGKTHSDSLKFITKLTKDEFPTYNFYQIIPFDTKKVNRGNGKYIIIREICPGSGHFIKERFFRIGAGENKIKEVKSEFESLKKYLKEDQSFYKGYEIDYNNGLKFVRNIYNKGDANCCATGGRIEGNYKPVYRSGKEPLLYFELENVKLYDKPLK